LLRNPIPTCVSIWSVYLNVYMNNITITSKTVRVDPQILTIQLVYYTVHEI